MITITQQESHGMTGREEAIPGSLWLACLLGYKGWGGGWEVGTNMEYCTKV